MMNNKQELVSFCATAWQWKILSQQGRNSYTKAKEKKVEGSLQVFKSQHHLPALILKKKKSSKKLDSHLEVT